MKRKGILFIVATFLISFILTGCRVEITATYDTVVLGSGISSLTSALTLSEQGKRVLIVDESGIVGGNKRLISDGISYLNTDGGDSVETFTEDINQNNGTTNFFTQKMVERSAEIPMWLQKYNIQLEKTVKLPGHSIARTLVSAKGLHTGKEVITKLETALKENKIEINYNSKITKIIPGKNGVYQLTIEQQNSIITVNAKTFILAEDEKIVYDSAVPITSMEQLDPNNFQSLTATSVGMELLSSLNGDFTKNSELNVIDTYNISSAQQISAILRSYGGILVNSEGNRFVDEMSDSPRVIEAILAQENQNAYLIYDNVIDNNLSFLNEYYKEKTLVKTTSITSLANSLNMNEENLRTTIASYRQMVINGEDTEFLRSLDVDNDIFSALGTDSGNLFAIKVTPVVTAFSSYAEITDKFEVMKKGVAIPGIYATGDSVSEVRLNDMLHGTELTNGIIMGQITAESVLAYLAEHNL